MAGSAVEGSAVPVIPAPLQGSDFLKASHIQLGAERGVPGGAHRPLSHIHFPPIWGFHRPAPAPQPPKGQVLSRAQEDSGETCSETRLAYPEKPLQPVTPAVPLQPGVRMHADPRIRVLTSTMRESFPWPHAPLHRPPLPTTQKDNIPCGDQEKIKLPPSVYSLSYPAPKLQPVVRPSPQGEMLHRPLHPPQTLHWAPGK